MNYLDIFLIPSVSIIADEMGMVIRGDGEAWPVVSL